jgi:ABC-2 type transport system ATP-binding protein
MRAVAPTSPPLPVAAVETRALTKCYASGVQALAGVDLDIERGEIFALLGANGAGKTTWISIVCGLTRPSSGAARVFGHPAGSLAARRMVGLVPQEISVDGFFDVIDVLRFQMGYHGLPPDDRRIDEVLRALALYDKRRAATSSLSGGMKRRLLIAKALVHRPKVVFLDEPTAGVDVNLRHDLWSYLHMLRAEGTTIVLTTHYLEEAEALADRVSMIDRGRLLVLDTPRRLLARYGGARVRISLTRPLQVVPAGLAALGARASADGLELICPLAGPDGQRLDVGRVVAESAVLNEQYRITDLRTEQPTLEQAFMALVAR